MNRLKALYRSWAIPCAGQQVYALRYRSEWLSKIAEPGVRRRAEPYYQQLDALDILRQEVRRDLLAESRKHSAMKWLRQIPSIGPIRAALLIALIQTPHRFRTKRQLWAYSGLALKTYSSGEYRFVEGQLKRSKRLLAIRGLNTLHGGASLVESESARSLSSAFLHQALLHDLFIQTYQDLAPPRRCESKCPCLQLTDIVQPGLGRFWSLLVPQRLRRFHSARAGCR